MSSKFRILAIGCFFSLAAGCSDEEKDPETAQCTSSETSGAASLTEGCPAMEVPVAAQPSANQGSGTVNPGGSGTCNAPKKLDPNTNMCIDMILADAKDSTTCHLLAGKWYLDSCNAGIITCNAETKPNSAGESCIPKLITEWTTRAACAEHNGYWYDQSDVSKTSAAEFAALVPSCHEAATDFCPEDGDIVAIARRADNSIVYRDVASISYYGGYDTIAEILTPIRCFQNLTTLNLQNNNIVSLDVRANTALIDLNLSDNQLASLDVSKNSSLINLDINGNPFAAPVNLSTLTNLQNLAVGNAGAMSVANVNFTQHPSLMNLNLAGSNLSSFNFSTLPAYLTGLDLSSTSVTALDLTRFTQLQVLYATQNYSMSSINLTGLTALTDVVAYSGGLTSIDVSDQVNLTHLEVDGNNLTSIDLTANTQLQTLWLSYNAGLTSLDISANTALENLYLGGLNITGALDLTHLTNLMSLQLSYSAWSSVDLSNSPNMYGLGADNMVNFTLDFTKLHATFLSATFGYISIEAAKWAGATGSAPAWTFDDWGNGIYNYHP